MTETEQLMRDALNTIKTLETRARALAERVADLEIDLAKARGEASLESAMLEAYHAPQPNVVDIDPSLLISGMQEAQKARLGKDPA